MTTSWTLTFDAGDPHRAAAFWAYALGYVAEPGYDDPDGTSIVDPHGTRPAISFLRVPEPKTAKNRVHIDIRVGGEPQENPAAREQRVRDKVAELADAGAVVVHEVTYGGSFSHVVMRDPDGNEFDVA